MTDGAVTTITPTDLAALHRKLDFLTEQFEAQRRRQAELDELKQDLIPIANHMIKLWIDELAEIGNDFDLSDLLFLVKRLLRDTSLIVQALGWLEGVADLGREAELLIHPMFNQTVEALDELERKGYFRFASGLWYVMERITDEFSEEDVRELGDNVVTILHTVRNMTQPEIMALANNAIEKIDDPVPDQVSTWTLLRELRDPQVRRGMVRMLHIVKTFAEDIEPNGKA